MEREALPKRALELERDLAATLAPLAEHPLVGEVRAGTGVLAAVQFAAEALEADAGLPARVVKACRANGILTRALGIGALQVSPALILTQGELAELRDGVRAALDAA
jgi:adenosylmethionine-8-amino-7-oxononanoate aminotransferase